ncbi:MAG: dicarboxylate/amino acid:cation symporter [Cellulosilyticum sp.]|nr:dicarboxylate/amino acid:cation symporter [Cellulosilyticum sp.]
MKKLNLSTKIFISLILGIILGVVIKQFELVFLLENIIQPIGTIFLSLLKMIIVPLVFTTLIASITNVGDMSKLGFLGKKTLIYYACTTLIAALIGVVLATLIGPGKGVMAPTDGFVAGEQATFASLIVGLVPTNIFKAFVEGNMLQVVIVAIFVGVAITLLGDEAKQVKEFNNQCVSVIYKIVELIMKTAPIAVLALIADVIANNETGIIWTLVKLIIVIVIGCFAQLAVYAVSVKVFGKKNPIHFYKTILPAQVFSFTTASSAATLPISMKCAKEGLGVSDTVANFVLNLGSTINMDGGAIYQSACAVFIAQIYGVDLSITQLAIIVITASLASVGAAAIPGTVIVMMTMVLSSVGLPLDAIALIAGIDRILDMCTTSVNVSGDIAACTFVSAMEKDIE